MSKHGHTRDTRPNDSLQRFELTGRGAGFPGDKGLVNNQTESAGPGEPTARWPDCSGRAELLLPLVFGRRSNAALPRIGLLNSSLADSRI